MPVGIDLIPQPGSYSVVSTDGCASGTPAANADLGKESYLSSDERRLMTLLNQDPHTTIQAFRDIYACDQLKACKHESGIIPGTQIVVLDDMSQFESQVQAQKIIETEPDGSVIQHEHDVEHMIVFVDCSISNLSRLNRNDLLEAQLTESPIHDKDIAAKHLQLIPINMHKTPVDSHCADLIRRQDILLKDAIAKLRVQHKLDKLFERVDTLKAENTQLIAHATAEPLKKVIDCSVDEVSGLFQNDINLDENGNQRYSPSTLASFLESAAPGTVIQLQIAAVSKADQAVINAAIDQCNTHRVIRQKFWESGNESSCTIKLAPAVILLPPIYTEGFSDAKELSVIRGDYWDCDTVLNTANFDSHVQASAVVDDVDESCMQKASLKTHLSQRIFIADELDDSQWLRLSKALTGNETLVICNSISARYLPTSLRMRLDDSPREIQPQAHCPIQHINPDEAEVDRLLSDPTACSVKQHTIRTIVSPDTKFLDLLSSEEEEKRADGYYFQVTESELIKRLRSGEPVLWEISGINEDVQAHLDTLLCQTPYLCYQGKHVPAPNLEVRLLSSECEATTVIPWAQAMKQLLLNKGFSAEQVTDEHCDKTMAIVQRFLDLRAMPMSMTLLLRVCNQIQARQRFETSHYYQHDRSKALSPRLIHRALRQSLLRQYKGIQRAYWQLGNHIKEAFLAQFPEVKKDYTKEFLIDTHATASKLEAYNSIRKNIEAFLFEHKERFDSEKEWLRCTDKLVSAIYCNDDSRAGEHIELLNTYKSDSSFHCNIQSQQQRIAKKEAQLVDTVSTQFITVLQGDPGAGKTHIAQKVAPIVASRLGDDCKSYLFQCQPGQSERDITESEPFQQWLITGGVIIFDEATLAANALLQFESLIRTEPAQFRTEHGVIELTKHRMIFTGNPVGVTGRSNVIGLNKYLTPSMLFKDHLLNEFIIEIFQEENPNCVTSAGSLYDKLASCKVINTENLVFSIREFSSVLLRAYKISDAILSDEHKAFDLKTVAFNRACIQACHELFADVLDLSPLDVLETDDKFDFEQIPPNTTFEQFFETFKQEQQAKHPALYICTSDKRYIHALWHILSDQDFAKSKQLSMPFQRALSVTGQAGRGKDCILAAVLDSLNVESVEIKDIDLDNFEQLIQDIQEAAAQGKVIRVPEGNLLPSEVIESLNDILTKACVIFTQNDCSFKDRNQASEALMSRTLSLSIDNRNDSELLELVELLLTDDDSQKSPDQSSEISYKPAPQLLARQLLFFHLSLGIRLAEIEENLLNIQQLIDCASSIKKGIRFEEAFMKDYCRYLDLLNGSELEWFENTCADYSSTLEEQVQAMQTKHRQAQQVLETQAQIDDDDGEDEAPSLAQTILDAKSNDESKKHPKATPVPAAIIEAKDSDNNLKDLPKKRKSRGCSLGRLSTGLLIAVGTATAGLSSWLFGASSSSPSDTLGQLPPAIDDLYIEGLSDSPSCHIPGQLTPALDDLHVEETVGVASSSTLEQPSPAVDISHTEIDAQPNGYLKSAALRSEEVVDTNINAGHTHFTLYHTFESSRIDDTFAIFNEYTATGDVITEVPYAKSSAKNIRFRHQVYTLSSNARLSMTITANPRLLPRVGRSDAVLDVTHSHPDIPIVVEKAGAYTQVRLENADDAPINTDVQWRVVTDPSHAIQSSEESIEAAFLSLTSPFSMERLYALGDSINGVPIRPDDFKRLEKALSTASTTGEALVAVTKFNKDLRDTTVPKKGAASLFDDYYDKSCKLRSMAWVNIVDALNLLPIKATFAKSAGHAFPIVDMARVSPGQREDFLKIQLGGAGSSSYADGDDYKTLLHNFELSQLLSSGADLFKYTSPQELKADIDALIRIAIHEPIAAICLGSAVAITVCSLMYLLLLHRWCIASPCFSRGSREILRFLPWKSILKAMCTHDTGLDQCILELPDQDFKYLSKHLWAKEFSKLQDQTKFAIIKRLVRFVSENNAVDSGPYVYSITTLLKPYRDLLRVLFSHQAIIDHEFERMHSPFFGNMQHILPINLKCYLEHKDNTEQDYNFLLNLGQSNYQVKDYIEKWIAQEMTKANSEEESIIMRGLLNHHEDKIISILEGSRNYWLHCEERVRTLIKEEKEFSELNKYERHRLEEDASHGYLLLTKELTAYIEKRLIEHKLRVDKLDPIIIKHLRILPIAMIEELFSSEEIQALLTDFVLSHINTFDTLEPFFQAYLNCRKQSLFEKHDYDRFLFIYEDPRFVSAAKQYLIQQRRDFNTLPGFFQKFFMHSPKSNFEELFDNDNFIDFAEQCLYNALPAYDKIPSATKAYFEQCTSIRSRTLRAAIIFHNASLSNKLGTVVKASYPKQISRPILMKQSSRKKSGKPNILKALRNEPAYTRAARGRTALLLLNPIGLRLPQVVEQQVPHLQMNSDIAINVVHCCYPDATISYQQFFGNYPAAFYEDYSTGHSVSSEALVFGEPNAMALICGAVLPETSSPIAQRLIRLQGVASSEQKAPADFSDLLAQTEATLKSELRLYQRNDPTSNLDHTSLRLLELVGELHNQPDLIGLMIPLFLKHIPKEFMIKSRKAMQVAHRAASTASQYRYKPRLDLLMLKHCFFSPILNKQSIARHKQIWASQFKAWKTDAPAFETLLAQAQEYTTTS